MGPIWGRQDPGGPHVGPMNFAIWENLLNWIIIMLETDCLFVHPSAHPSMDTTRSRYWGLVRNVNGAGRLNKIFGFSAKYEVQNISFIHSFTSKFRLQRAALGALNFQTPWNGVIVGLIMAWQACPLWCQAITSTNVELSSIQHFKRNGKLGHHSFDNGLLPAQGVGGAVRFLVVGTIGQEERPPRGQLWMEQCLTSLKYWPI